MNLVGTLFAEALHARNASILPVSSARSDLQTHLHTHCTTRSNTTVLNAGIHLATLLAARCHDPGSRREISSIAQHGNAKHARTEKYASNVAVQFQKRAATGRSTAALHAKGPLARYAVLSVQEGTSISGSQVAHGMRSVMSSSVREYTQTDQPSAQDVPKQFSSLCLHTVCINIRRFYMPLYL